MRAEDPRLAAAHAVPMAELVERLGIAGLQRAGAELVGPCPRCGGTDRFGIHLTSGVFQCRKDCGPAAKGDQISLVRHVLDKSFPDALDWLAGPAQDLTPDERRDLARRAEDNRRRRAETEARLRAASVAAALKIWRQTVPAEGTPVRDYLALRGIPARMLPELPPALRYLPDCPYMVADEERAGHWRMVHSGPAMVAGVLDAHGTVTAVHRTWIDLDTPSGKAAVADPLGRRADLPAKKVLGSKKGGAIRLRSVRGATTLYMGEGIETTLSALVAEDPPGRASFWAGVDLGNMAGRRHLGQGLKFAGLPDLDDADAFVPPPQIRKLVYIQDGDSDPRLTRAQLEAGLRRAMALRPGLAGAIVHAGEGRDLNDVLRGSR